MAAKLNAELKLNGGATGTRVSLSLPFEREAKAPKQSAA
jgi:hypothetical protein